MEKQFPRRWRRIIIREVFLLSSSTRSWFMWMSRDVWCVFMYFYFRNFLVLYRQMISRLISSPQATGLFSYIIKDLTSKLNLFTIKKYLFELSIKKPNGALDRRKHFYYLSLRVWEFLSKNYVSTFLFKWRSFVERWKQIFINVDRRRLKRRFQHQLRVFWRDLKDQLWISAEGNEISSIRR